MNAKLCPRCGDRLVASRKEQRHLVAGRTFVAIVAAVECRRCNDVFLESASLECAEIEIACEIARSGPIDGAAFRFLRKALGFQSAKVAELLGVTPETISRWENGQRAVDATACITLGSIVLERAQRSPATLERLHQLRGPRRAARVVRIDVSARAEDRPRARHAK